MPSGSPPTFGGIDDTFVVLNGDVLTDFDISGLVDVPPGAGAEGTIGLTPVDDPSSFGVVPTDADGKVTAFIEKPPRDEAPTNLINAGIYILEPSVLGRIAPDVRVSIERETFPAMVADGTLYARGSDAYWLDTGTPDAYLRAHRDLLNGRRSGPPAPDAVSRPRARPRGLDHRRGRRRAGFRRALAARAGRVRGAHGHGDRIGRRRRVRRSRTGRP